MQENLANVAISYLPKGQMILPIGSSEHPAKPSLHAGHRQRLKERFLKEPVSLADYELLELLLFLLRPVRIPSH
jgi:hypothetical protein